VTIRTNAMSIGDMIAEVREVNTALGWRAEPKTLGDFVALLHSEVTEALEAYRDHRLTDATRPVCGRAASGEEPCPEHGPSKPEGVGSELADCVVRLFDACDVLGMTVWDVDNELADVPPILLVTDVPAPLTTFGDYMAWLHRVIDRMWSTREAHRVLRALVTVAEKFGIDLTAEYTRKIAYNRTREYQHGGRTLSDAR
jgi:hypothetical protein